MGIKYCPNCGKEVEENASFCPHCAFNLSGMQSSKRDDKVLQIALNKKSEGLAAVLSFIIPGLGQIYLGKLGRGLLILIGSILIGVVSVFLLFIPLLIFWIWQIFDAYNLAKRYNIYLAEKGEPPW